MYSVMKFNKVVAQHKTFLGARNLRNALDLAAHKNIHHIRKEEDMKTYNQREPAECR